MEGHMERRMAGRKCEVTLPADRSGHPSEKRLRSRSGDPMYELVSENAGYPLITI